MRVSRSLTIKQMAMVSVVALITICIFVVIQLFHFVDQRKEDYVQQLENLAHSVREPLSEAMLNMDAVRAQKILDSLVPIGILSRADVMLPNELQALKGRFPQERAVPEAVMKIFDLPVQVSMPLYGIERNIAARQPSSYLVLQADSFRIYQFILSTLSTMVSTYLLLALILTVAISWCMNRLLVYPLRALAQELRSMPLDTPNFHQLTPPPSHGDDELGLLVRNYNRNQQALEKAHQVMSRMSTRNPLTNLPNMTLFVPLLEQHLLVCRKENSGIVVINISTLQEAMGVLDTTQRDALLASLVSRLNECVSEADMLAQVNQDRFVVLVRNVERPHSLMLLAKNLMDSITRQLDLETLALRPTASIGISFYQPNAEETMDAKKEAELLLSQASSAMNMAMREGKNQILFFEPRLARKAKERLTKETEIMNALTQGDFSLYLQPQIDLRTGRLAGAEALIRWNRKDGELTLPSEFIPLAEEVGGIEALDEWVISESMKILSAWQKQNIGVPISLNVSGIQIANLSYVELLEKMLREYQLDPHMLHLEVTETAYISNMEQAAEMLARLRKIGIKIALDDFGMGYAGLNYLQHLPVDIIKIDKNFVDQIPANDALVRIVASIADVLALDVVAEGVESHMQCEWLLEHGIYYAQGYWFSPALPQEEFERKYFLI